MNREKTPERKTLVMLLLLAAFLLLFFFLKEFLSLLCPELRGGAAWLALLLVLLAAAFLAGLLLFRRRDRLRECDGTPDSPVYDLIFLLVRLWHGRRPRPVIDDALLRQVDAPYILLANHQSFFDFYYIYQMAHPRRPTFLVFL